MISMKQQLWGERGGRLMMLIVKCLTYGAVHDDGLSVDHSLQREMRLSSTLGATERERERERGGGRGVGRVKSVTKSKSQDNQTCVPGYSDPAVS